MTAIPEDFLVQAWKQQLDLGLRLIETMVEGAIKLREVQIEAATGAHADAVATRKSIAGASDLAQVIRLQAEWTRANAEKCAAYWRDLYEVATRTQGELASRAGVQPPAAVVEGEPNKALFGMIDDAYRGWLDATQKFYRIEPNKLADDKLPGEELAVPATPKPKPSRRATT
ncbi:MAG TPA: phasin family protein [Burkholderiales bacterium]|jgi:phasin family protein|nr:phasin family protein [Burkholderiales bacterium]